MITPTNRSRFQELVTTLKYINSHLTAIPEDTAKSLLKKLITEDVLTAWLITRVNIHYTFWFSSSEGVCDLGKIAKDHVLDNTSGITVRQFSLFLSIERKLFDILDDEYGWKYEHKKTKQRYITYKNAVTAIRLIIRSKTSIHDVSKTSIHDVIEMNGLIPQSSANGFAYYSCRLSDLHPSLFVELDRYAC